MASRSAVRMHSDFSLESLERRQLLCGTTGSTAAAAPLTATPAAVVVKPDTVATTTTRIGLNASSLLLGQTLSITVIVSSADGTPRGTVQLLNNGHTFGQSTTLNHLGHAKFIFDGGSAFFSGTYNFSIRYAGSSSFAVSRSHTDVETISQPTYTVESGHLRVATVVAGTGVGAVTGDMATMEYTGFLLNGTEFDESSVHSPDTLSFEVNGGTLITGFEEGTLGMKVGETRVLLIPWALGYGAEGDPPTIPAEADLVFVITMVSLT
jgi:FKBP-type peptidyl-prolyl isomerase-like protein/Big-like domain-containing protein